MKKLWWFCLSIVSKTSLLRKGIILDVWNYLSISSFSKSIRELCLFMYKKIFQISFIEVLSSDWQDFWSLLKRNCLDESLFAQRQHWWVSISKYHASSLNNELCKKYVNAKNNFYLSRFCYMDITKDKLGDIGTKPLL